MRAQIIIRQLGTIHEGTRDQERTKEATRSSGGSSVGIARFVAEEESAKEKEEEGEELDECRTSGCLRFVHVVCMVVAVASDATGLLL